MKRIPLTQGLYALVDDADHEWLSQWSDWYAGKVRNGAYRALRKDGKKTIYMHRLLMGDPKGKLVDHINGNPLDNQRHNLRVCSCAQNGYNKRIPKVKNRTSRYKGVSRTGKRWRARVFINGKNVHLGIFDSEIQAAIAYDAAATEYFGEYAHLNFKGALNRWNTNMNNNLGTSSQRMTGNQAAAPTF